MSNKIDIKYRNRIAINGNGQRLTKIKGGEIDPTFQVATIDLGIPAEANRPTKRIEENETKEIKENIPIEKDIQLNKLTEEEQATLKSLLTKLNG